MNFYCCTEKRRDAVKQHPTLNGIDYLEVLDRESDPYKERQTTLFLYFLKPVPPGSLGPSNIRIEGGERIKDIFATDLISLKEYVSPAAPPEDADKVLVLKVNQAGDFSTYTLRLVRNENPDLIPSDFDPMMAAIEFSFKAGCPSHFDCKSEYTCPPVLMASPQIDYLAKDYASFRQLMLDRMALLTPDWNERNPADIGITFVELLAYAADHLSYRQDAIATEAYLGTARRRISVRRHARLVDYFMHDGCNARAWVQIRVAPRVQGLLLEKGEGAEKTKILTRIDGLPSGFKIDSSEFRQALKEEVRVFELMHDLCLYSAHNEMFFHTWGNESCCLPKGATEATLAGDYSTLVPGDVLILAEIRGPVTGEPMDADPGHRHAVRLISVEIMEDQVFLVDGNPTTVTKIKWHPEDALPFPLCLSNDLGEAVSAALGNIVLADHGLTIQENRESALQPSIVPKATLRYANGAGHTRSWCDQDTPDAIPVRYRPVLRQKDLTFAASLNAVESATGLMKWLVSDARPVINLEEVDDAGNRIPDSNWAPQRDLLNSAGNAREFVVEVERDQIPYLRFGDNTHGKRPNAETIFRATYRIGNGPKGNVGADTLCHLATNNLAVLASLSEEEGIWNPLPAQGGQKEESLEEVRRYAPQAFRKQRRAVVLTDYEEFAKECKPEIQRATANIRWTGSWPTVFLSVDRAGGKSVTPAFEESLRNELEEFRLAGIDLEVEDPVYVSLEIDMTVCVHPDFYPDNVEQALLQVFSNRILSDGTLGIFHPDHFSFGQPVYLSPFYAAAQKVEGVASVQITKFQRRENPGNEGIDTGKLEFGRREIARCDNNPNFPDRGLFKLTMQAGRSI